MGKSLSRGRIFVRLDLNGIASENGDYAQCVFCFQWGAPLYFRMRKQQAKKITNRQRGDFSRNMTVRALNVRFASLHEIEPAIALFEQAMLGA